MRQFLVNLHSYRKQVRRNRQHFIPFVVFAYDNHIPDPTSMFTYVRLRHDEHLMGIMGSGVYVYLCKIHKLYSMAIASATRSTFSPWWMTELGCVSAASPCLTILSSAAVGCFRVCNSIPLLEPGPCRRQYRRPLNACLATTFRSSEQYRSSP